MVRKTVRIFKRLTKSWDEGGESHIEKVVRETWWLFGVIPLYSRDTVQTSNL